MAVKSILTANRLRELLSYNPETGEFIWLIKPSNRCRNVAGWIGHAGGGLHYRQIGVDGQIHWAHRLAFLWMEGRWPNRIDHIDRNTLNNAWANLREVTASQNSRNTKRRSDNLSGAPGVYWKRDKQKWRVSLCGKHIGYFDDREEAIRVATALRKDWIP